MQLFSLSGRISRRTYWLNFVLLVWIVVVIARFADMALVHRPMFALIATPVASYISLAGGVRRCHDRNRSGWWLLISLTVIGLVWLFVELGFLRGTRGPNRFGPDPTRNLDRSALSAAT